MVFKKTAIIGAAIIIFVSYFSSAQMQGGRFVFSQLKYEGNWDTDPEAYANIYQYMVNTTSIKALPERRIISIDDPLLFNSPFLVISGSGSFPEFSGQQLIRFKRYIEGGGMIFVDSDGNEEFNTSIDGMFRKIFPDRKFFKIPQEHAVFRAFYLIDYVSGRSINFPYLEYIETEGRIAVIKSRNSLLGVWARDAMGNWKNALMPDKPDQRKEAIKLSLNMIMYSVCETYKSDPVHQGDIRRKLGR